MRQAAVLHGTVTDTQTTGGGPLVRGSLYTVAGEDGNEYQFDYTDIVRETFRTVTIDERVRFIPAPDHPTGPRATYVILMSDFRDLFYRDLEPPNADGSRQGVDTAQG